jgi:hypothetical protein
MERIRMRVLVISVIALVVGFIAGLVLSEMIGIIGFVGFHRAIGIKYLPVYLAIVSAVVANLLDRLIRNRSGKG